MDSSIEEARAKMIAARFGGNSKGAHTGGSKAPRRQTKGPIKSVGGKMFKENFLRKFIDNYCFLLMKMTRS